MSMRFTGLRRSRRVSVVPALLVATVLTTSLAACGSSDAGEADGDAPASGDLTTQEQLKPDYETDQEIRALLPASVQDSGVLKAALSAGNPPLTIPGKTANTVAGVIPDLQSAIAQILGVEIEGSIYPTTASQLLALDSKRVDIAFSTNSDTRERQATYQFVDYFKSNYILAVQGDNVGEMKSWEDLCGGGYGSVKGSIDIIDQMNESCTDAGKDAPEVSYFEDVPALLLAAKSGRIDTFFTPSSYVVWGKANGETIDQIDPPTPADTFYGFTVSKDGDQIAEAVLAALEKLVADGYYEKALERWNLEDGQMTPGINIGDQSAMFG
ncbi:transporter substrate-binding domain-containing protein [Nocardioides sp. L-11A]|uniref:transporter substrate-binding domain-containing protein n=1 Tax=Nocardioides sp. L-11A TaxID=3043848 RepID=UPI00249A11B3|nr:transporter substrate-binding domain-containing protein [Nocardioides sp. L-11A]